MAQPDFRANFEKDVLPYLGAAYNLARWMTRDSQDAQDVVQEAYMRAYRFFGGFRGESVRPWLLKIVRNTCFTWMEQNRPRQPATEFDEELVGPDPRTRNPEDTLLRKDSGKLLRRALETLPRKFREVLVLRELEGMSYKEISEVTGMPPGTVMSRLSRARGGLRQSLSNLSGPVAAPVDDQRSRAATENRGLPARLMRKP